jgi:Ca2+-binding RTX toxin-like protein
MALNANEQYFLELTNRARLDPLAEAAGFGISLNDGLAAGTLNGTSKQVLSPNELLEKSSEGHSQWMLDNNVFAHEGKGGSNAGERMIDAGYEFTGSWTWGENLAWYGTTGTLNISDVIEQHHEGLFRSEGHRENTLAGAFKEVGVAQIAGTFTSEGKDYNSSMLTANYAKTGSSNFLTGVAYTDKNNNDFYDIGEGKGSVSFGIVNGDKVSTAAAGGWALETTATGKTLVDIKNGQSTSRVEMNILNENVKLDLLGTTKIITDGDVRLVSGSVVDVETVGDGNTTITGNTAANLLEGGRGNNTLNGEDGNDFLYGGDGTDKLYGGMGDDNLLGDGGNDLMYASHGNDQLFGGSGNDSMYGESGDDLLRSHAGDDLAYGGSGNDTLEGQSGKDTLYGGDDDDLIYGHLGQDKLYGGSGADTMYGGQWKDLMYGGTDNDILYGGQGSDNLSGNNGNDKLFGDIGNDRLHGNNGNDIIYGGDGNDQLFGGNGTDALYGGNGNDRLDGSFGNDALTGGAGADKFVFRNNETRDKIVDFSHSDKDVILLDADFYGQGTSLSNILSNHTTIVDGNTHIDLGGGDYLDVIGVTDLTTSDFGWL